MNDQEIRAKALQLAYDLYSLQGDRRPVVQAHDLMMTANQIVSFIKTGTFQTPTALGSISTASQESRTPQGLSV